MIRPVLVVSLLAVSCSAVAQVKTFELGALRSDVLTEFGTPENQEERVDVFMRESPTNAYEVHVHYHFDNRQSRLRPKPRVSWIEFIVDKPNNFKETLADLPEVKAICRPSLSFLEGECSLYGLKRLGLGGYQVLAYPINPSAELLDLGGQAACGFEECNTTTTWGIGIYLKLERQTWGRSPPNWNSKISEVEISPVCLQCELDPSNFDTYSIPRPVKLGTW